MSNTWQAPSGAGRPGEPTPYVPPVAAATNPFEPVSAPAGNPSPYSAPAYAAPAYAQPAYAPPTYAPSAYGPPVDQQQPVQQQPVQQQLSYQQPAPGQPMYPQPMYPQPVYSGPRYAHWGRRVGAYLLDGLAFVPYWVGYGIAVSTLSLKVTGGVAVMSDTGYRTWAVGAMISLVLWVWNRGFRQGRTGQSFGKKVAGITLLRLADGQPLGTGKALWRDLVHILDCFIFYLGFWWPLWDVRRQTFADKIVNTCVVK